MGSLKPNARRARSAVFFMYILMAVELLSIIWNSLKLKMVMSITVGHDNPDYSDMLSYLVTELVVMVLVLVITLTGTIKLLKWFRRAYFNLHVKVTGLAYSEGWAVASWFVPVVFFYGPYQITKELHVEMDRMLKEKGIPVAETHFFLIRIWWALWILITILGILDAVRAFYTIGFLDEACLDAISDIIMSVLLIPVYALTIKIIKAYSIKEKLLFDLG